MSKNSDELEAFPLRQMLIDVGDGIIQIPEFQRRLRIDDDWVKSCISSVSLGYSIGAVMLLEAGSPDIQFRSYPVQGVSPSKAEPKWLLIDGQQRITTLFQVFSPGHSAQARDVKDKPVLRGECLIDINAALDPNIDREEAIIFTEESSVAIGEDMEWEKAYFPLNLVFSDPSEIDHWKNGFINKRVGNDAKERENLMSQFTSEVIEVIQSYIIPAIILNKDTTRWSIRVHGGQEGKHLSERFRVSNPLDS